MAMSDFRVRPRALSSTTAARLSEKEVSASGLPKDLFGWAKVAYRRVDRVTPTHVEVEGGRVPRSGLGEVKAGQWLRFAKLDGDGGVEVKVDLGATRRAEGRLADLFDVLKKR